MLKTQNRFVLGDPWSICSTHIHLSNDVIHALALVIAV